MDLEEKGDEAMRMYMLTECCTLFGVNLKTFHKWLNQEGIRPQSSRADTRVRYVTQEQVEYLIRVYGRKSAAREGPPSDDLPVSVESGAFAERLSQCEQRLCLLEDEARRYNEMLSTVQQHLETLTAQPVQRSAAPSSPPTATSTNEHRPRPAAQAKKQRGKHLPRTLVLLRAFAEQHQVSMKQASAAGQADKITVVRGKWLVNSRWATEALDQRGQQEFYAVFHTKEGFLPCALCPHEPSM